MELIKLAVGAAKIGGGGILTKDNLNSQLRRNFNDNSITVGEIQEGWNYKNYKINTDGKVENLLPKDYQQVKYIQGNGRAFIDTKYNINANSKIIYKAAVTSSSIGEELHFGHKDNTNGTAYIEWYTGRIIYNFGTSGWIGISFNPTNNQFYNIELSSNGLYIGGDKLTDVNIVKSLQNTPSSYIFARNENNSASYICSHIQIASFSFLENNILKRDYIPCYCTTTVTDVDEEQCSAGTIGMYDTVNGQFYVNKGTGTFGYETLDGTYVAPQ